MAVEQVVVLALIVAGFVAGWVARGASRGGEAARARAALERVLADPSPEALAELREADAALEAAVGADDAGYATFDAAANIAVRQAQDRLRARR